ncbi:MAG: nuclear transport factor 2 family protein [Gemmatimonadota bacterium]|jgi:ketosteroid isomerase-like protein
MSMLRCVPISLLGFTLIACAPQEEAQGPTREEDLAGIAEARNAILSALHNDDIDGIMAALIDDHLTMAPGAPTVPDNEALFEWHQNRIDLYSFESEHSTDDILLEGDIAVERWSGPSRLVSRGDGSMVEDFIKGIWVWQRQPDGSWKLLWSIWNSDLPVGTDWAVGEGG